MNCFKWFKRAPRVAKFVAWYRPPDRFYRKQPVYWLSKDMAGFWFCSRKEWAHKFDTEDEAKLTLGSYDGSPGFPERAGVVKIWESLEQ